MKKVELGGKERPIRFSYLCLKEICGKCKLKLNQLNQLGSEIDHVGIIAYYGLKHGAKEWIDNEEFSKINEIFEAFQFDQPQSEGK